MVQGDLQVNITEQAAETLRQLKPRSQFVCIRGYVKEAGNERLTQGVSDVTLCLGIDYGKALEKAKKAVQEADLGALAVKGLKGCENARKADSPVVPVTIEHLEAARSKILESYKLSQEGGHRKTAGKEDVYTPLLRQDGTPVTGVKIHRETGNLHIWGFLIYEHKLADPVYKESRRGVDRVAREALEDLTPLKKFRNYVLKAGGFNCLRLDGVEIWNGLFREIEPLL